MVFSLFALYNEINIDQFRASEDFTELTCIRNAQAVESQRCLNTLQRKKICNQNGHKQNSQTDLMSTLPLPLIISYFTVMLKNMSVPKH